MRRLHPPKRVSDVVQAAEFQALRLGQLVRGQFAPVFGCAVPGHVHLGQAVPVDPAGASMWIVDDRRLQPGA